MGTVNRSLADPMMDDIDHALGRPKDAFGGYRNFYVASNLSPEAGKMAASHYWKKSAQSERDFTVFTVTMEGREALNEYLKTKV